jgi:hypothetical protein
MNRKPQSRLPIGAVINRTPIFIENRLPDALRITKPVNRTPFSVCVQLFCCRGTHVISHTAPQDPSKGLADGSD